MTTAYTSLLGLALPVQGELQGTWGDTVNTQITQLLDTAVAGTTTLSTDADVTLTTTTGASNQARQAILLWTANGTTTRNITAPAQSKIYTVINASAGTQSIVLRGVGPTTGVTILKGESAVCAWNGSDFIKISNTGGSGSFTDLTVSGSLTLSGGTANGVAYLNGSKVVTTGSALTFDGTNLSTTGSISTSSTNGYNVQVSGGNAYRMYATTNDLVFRSVTAGSDVMTLTYGGSVGIGTSSPVGTLDVVSPSSSLGMNLRGRSSDDIGTLSFYTNNGVTNMAQVQMRPADNEFRFLVGGARSLTYYTNGSERARFNSSGDFLVGSAVATYNAAGRGVVEVNGGSTAIMALKINGGGAGYTYHDGSVMSIGNVLNGPMAFFANNAEKGRFTASGVLAIGTTTSSSTQASVIEGVYGNLSFSNSLGNALAGNVYYDGSWKYKANSTGNLFLQDSNGTHFYYSTGGAVGSAVTWQYLWRFNSDGAILDIDALGSKYLRLNTSSGGDGHLLLLRAGSNKWQISSGATNALQFYNYTAGSEAMRIDSASNINIAATSSSLGSTGGPAIRLSDSSIKSFSYTGGSASGGTINITPSNGFGSNGNFCFMFVITAKNTANSNYNRVQMYVVTFRSTNFSGSSILKVADTYTDTGTNGEITTMSVNVNSFSTNDLCLQLTTATRGAVGSVFGTLCVIGN